MNLISGGMPERFIGADCKSADPSGRVGSNPTPSAIFATGTEALTSAPAFNHTQPKLYGPKQPELYLSGCVFQTRSTQQWTNNNKENNAAW